MLDVLIPVNTTGIKPGLSFSEYHSETAIFSPESKQHHGSDPMHMHVMCVHITRHACFDEEIRSSCFMLHACIKIKMKSLISLVNYQNCPSRG